MRERMRWAIRWPVWLCLSLMLWTATVESVHHHPSQTESTSCSICVAAHTTRPTVSSHQARPIFSTVSLLHEEEIIARPRLDAVDLGIRGPPVA
jgi:hypothetical protein